MYQKKACKYIYDNFEARTPLSVMEVIDIITELDIDESVKNAVISKLESKIYNKNETEDAQPSVIKRIFNTVFRFIDVLRK